MDLIAGLEHHLILNSLLDMKKQLQYSQQTMSMFEVNVKQYPDRLQKTNLDVLSGLLSKKLQELTLHPTIWGKQYQDDQNSLVCQIGGYYQNILFEAERKFNLLRFKYNRIDESAYEINLTEHKHITSNPSTLNLNNRQLMQVQKSLDQIIQKVREINTEAQKIYDDAVLLIEQARTELEVRC